MIVALSLLCSKLLYLSHILFSLSLVGRHLNCFQFWGIINNNIKSVLDYASWYICSCTSLVYICLTVKLLGHRVYVASALLDKAILVFLNDLL